MILLVSVIVGAVLCTICVCVGVFVCQKERERVKAWVNKDKANSKKAWIC